MENRDYQTSALHQIRCAIRDGYKDILVVSPTGSGKTVIGAQVMNSARQKYKHSIFAAHRREIIHQTSDKLDKFDCPHGVILAGEARAPVELTQVCSIQTFNSRHILGDMRAPECEIIIFDEAHRSLAATYQIMRSMYPDAILIGLTATPCRGDGRGLGKMYKILIEVISVRELIDLGFLVEPKVFAPVEPPDLSDVKTSGDDWARTELEEIMDTQQLVGNVLHDWQSRASDRQTVIFASGVRHSKHIYEEFKNAGIEIEHIDGETEPNLRDDILVALEHGDIKCVTNADVLLEGWDCPPVSCAVLARPTKSYGLYLQMAGRTMRPFYGKTDSLIIDHAGAVYRHGFVQDAGNWSLNPDEKITERRAKAAAEKTQEELQTTCRECWTVYNNSPYCPECGYKPTAQARDANFEEGRLQFVKRVKTTEQKRQDFWNSCYFRCLHSGKKIGVAAHMYKKEYGVFPNGLTRLPKNKDEWNMTTRKFDDLYKSEGRWDKEKPSHG